MKDCSRHLKEAIAINSERKQLYAELSGGATLPFSKKLIRYERLALSGAWIFDRIGAKYQRRGVPYMKYEFVEMSEVGTFQSHYPKDINFAAPLIPIDFTTFTKLAKKYNRKKEAELLVNLCQEKLLELESQKHVYCMVRHIIESVRRIAYLIPIHEKQCAGLGIKPPTNYSSWLIWSHLLLIPQSIKFDQEIAPIQNKNIPFLYQDLPHIPMEVEALK